MIRWINSRINYAKMKISLTYHFIRYIYQNCTKIMLEYKRLNFFQ